MVDKARRRRRSRPVSQCVWCRSAGTSSMLPVASSTRPPGSSCITSAWPRSDSGPPCGRRSLTEPAPSESQGHSRKPAARHPQPPASKSCCPKRRTERANERLLSARLRLSIRTRRFDCLRTVTKSELGKDAGDVALDRRLTGDLRVRLPARQQPEHLELARAELEVGGCAAAR